MDSKNKTFISLAILGAFFLISVIFVINPMFEKIKENSDNFLSQKDELASLKAKSAYLREFKNIYDEDYNAQIEKIDKLFVDAEVPLDFINFLEKTAKNSQLTIKISPTISKEVETDIWSFIVFRIDLSGNFSDFLTFLEKIETSACIIEVLSLDISKAKDGKKN